MDRSICPFTQRFGPKYARVQTLLPTANLLLALAYDVTINFDLGNITKKSGRGRMEWCRGQIFDGILFTNQINFTRRKSWAIFYNDHTSKTFHLTSEL